jgi:serine protease AprX
MLVLFVIGESQTGEDPVEVNSRLQVHLTADAEYKSLLEVIAFYRGFATTCLVYRAISTIGADAVRKLYGAEGDGIVWAILSSGIDASHPHFAKHSNLEPSPFHFDFVSSDGVNRALEDECGNGTAAAGIVAGELEGKFKAVVRRFGPEGDVNYEPLSLTYISGVAPKCKLVSLKVLDDDGKGSVSNVIAAIAHI